MRLVRFALAPTLALLALVAAACQSTSASLARMHTSYLEETAEAGLSGTLRDGYTEKQTERRARVHAMHEAGEIRTTRDRLYAAALLVSGTELADLTLAEELALQAGQEGEVGGFRLAAQAIDKQLVRRGAMQRYGTQSEYSPVLRRWRLYPTSGATTDAERRSMGLPTLAQLRERTDALNALPR